MHTTNESRIQELADVHAKLIQMFLETGRLGSLEEIAASLHVTSSELTQRLDELSSSHGLVLHPHTPEPWVVHPFSTTPTAHFVQSSTFGWWAPCIWCALGIAQLAKGRVRIYTRLGAEADSVILDIEDGVPRNGEDLVVHFSIPPRDAWNNVHQHCSLVLPFRREADIASWCLNHGQKYGEPVSLANTAALARRWYGTYASSLWRKWTVEQAQQIFNECGLTSPFWALSGKGIY